MKTTKRTDYVGQLWDDFRGNRTLTSKEVLERFYLRWITEVAVNRFTWTGLPEEPEGDIRPRYVELMLFRRGLAVFFKHEVWDKYLCIQGTQQGNLDMYFDPRAFHLYGNGHVPEIDGKTVTTETAVPIWGNRLRVPDLDLVSIYARRLARFDNTIDVNITALQHPFVLAANDETRHTIIEAYRQVEDGMPVIIANDKVMDAKDIRDSFNVLNVSVSSDMMGNLLRDKKKVWNELLTYLGIQNANQDKRERLVTDEVAANNAEINVARAISLGARQEACEKINEKFGLNIWCEWNNDIDEKIVMPEGSYEDGDIHNDDSRTD